MNERGYLVVHSFEKIIYNGREVNVKDFPVLDYPKKYVELEKRWFAHWEKSFPIDEFNSFLPFDFKKAVFFKISKFYLEVPFRLGLHLREMFEYYHPLKIDLTCLPEFQGNVIESIVLHDVPRKLIVRASRNENFFRLKLIFSLLFFLIGSIAYSLLYHLRDMVRFDNNPPDFNNHDKVFFSFPRKYLTKYFKGFPVVLFPLSRPFFNVKDFKGCFYPFQLYTLKDGISSFFLLIRLFKVLFRYSINGRTNETREYLLPFLKYYFFQFPIVYDYFNIIRGKMMGRLPERWVVNNGNNDVVSALSELSSNRSVEIIHFQHGLMQTPLLFRTFCDKALLWSPFEVQLMKKYGFEKEYESSYYPKYFNTLNRANKPVVKDRPLVTVFTTLIDEVFGKPAWEDFISILQKGMKEHEKEFNWVIHNHPSFPDNVYAREFPGVLVDSGKAEYYMKSSDLIITVYSTILIEALPYGTPVFLYSSFLDEEETIVGKVSPRRKFNDLESFNELIKGFLKEITEKGAFSIKDEEQLLDAYFMGDEKLKNILGY